MIDVLSHRSWVFGLLLWFGFSNRPHLIGFLHGILTYALLASADYKVIGTGHIVMLLVLLVWVKP